MNDHADYAGVDHDLLAHCLDCQATGRLYVRPAEQQHQIERQDDGEGEIGVGVGPRIGPALEMAAE